MMRVRRAGVVSVLAVLLAGVPVGAWGDVAVADDAKADAVAPSAHSSSRLPAGQRARLRAAVRRGFREASTPGAVVAVRTPKGKWVKAVGRRSESDRSKAPLRAVVHQRIGSVTKTFIGALLMQLVGEGKLSFDDKVSEYVDGVPNGEEMTLRQVADMTSGVASYTAVPAFTATLFSDPERSWRPGELLEVGLANSPLFEPGTAFQYSDSNYVLLGLVIQQAEGKPIGAVLRKRIIKPLKLSDTSWPGKSIDLPKPHSRGYTLQGQPTDEPADATHWNPSSAWAAGGLISTVRDLLVYGRAFGTGKGLLSPRLQRERLDSFNISPPPLSSTLSYGIGLVDDMGWIGHTGSVPGYTTTLYYHPDIKTTVAVETNSDIASGECRGQETLIDDPFTGQCAIPADRIMGQVAASLRRPYQLPPG